MAGNREMRIVGPSAQLSDRKASAQRTVNMFVSATESMGEDKQFILRSAMGTGNPLATLSGALRGMLSSVGSSKLIYIDGSTVYRYDSGGPDAFGTALNSSSGACRMAEGNGIVVVVDGTDGYVGNISALTLAEITDVDFLGSSQVEFLDGYFIFADPGTDIFYISAIDDPTTLDALDLSSSDRLPDNIVALRVSKQELYIFGTHSCEIWYNNGGADFPFGRYTQAPIDIGLVGQDAVVKGVDSLFFIGKSDRGQAAVYMMDGHNPRRISTRAVEEAIFTSLSVISQSRMWTYQAAGAEFVGMEFGGASGVLTWVYNVATGMWHELASYVPTSYGPVVLGNTLGQLNVIDVATVDGVHYIGCRNSYVSPAVWVIASLTESDVTWLGQVGAFPRERTWPHLISPSSEPVKYASLELMCSGGAGGTVTLEVSNDGGTTFGTAQSRSLDDSRIRWFPLGQARDRVFRIRCTDNETFNIHGAQVEIG